MEEIWKELPFDTRSYKILKITIMTDLTIYFIILMGLIFIFGIAIAVNQKHIFERYENDYHDYMNHLKEIQGWVYEHNAQSAKNDDRIIDRLDHISYDIGKVCNDENHKLLTTSDRGTIDEIITALRSLGNEKMISYTKEIELLLKLKNF